MEEAVWYARKGSYRATVSFQKGSLETGFEDVSEYDLTVNILENSKACKFEEVELEFDGSQDITFYFENGTNLFEIAAITNLSIFTGMGNEEIKTVDVPDLTEGFSANLGENYTVLTRVELTEQKRAEVQEKVKNADSAIAKDYKIGSYYEISVKADVLSNGQSVEGMTDIAVPALMKKVSLNIAVPEALKKTGRTFVMYHYQNDKAVKLETKAKDNVLTFETDSFSPYVLTYKDAVGKGATSVPKTGDAGVIPVAVIMLSVVITAMAFCRRGKCQG